MKKILLLLTVCSLTAANAARPFTILNDTENYLVYGHLTAKDTLNCNDQLTIYDLEFEPGERPFITYNDKFMIGDIKARSLSGEAYHNSTNISSSSNRTLQDLSTNLFVNGSYEWSKFNFKAVHQSNPMLQDGTAISFIIAQICDNNLPYEWTGENGTSIARAESYTIGERMYITFTEQ